MTFTVHGSTNGNPVQVTWRDGRLEGDPGLVNLFQAYAQAGEPIATTLDGDVVEADLTDPVKAFLMIVGQIPVVTALEGDPPPGIDFCRRACRAARRPTTPRPTGTRPCPWLVASHPIARSRSRHQVPPPGPARGSTEAGPGHLQHKSAAVP